MKKNKKLIALFFAAAMSMSVAACGGKETAVTTGAAKTTTEESKTTEPAETTAAETKTSQAAQSETPAENKGPAAEGPLALNYEAEPEAYVGKWVLSGGYTAADGMLEVTPDTCYLELETSIDANKLVDEPKYIHADAVNLKGTMSFNHPDISVEPYKCSANWGDWTVVNVVGEGEAYFKGAVKFKIRDDDEGLFFDLLTGTTVEDMELFEVLGLNEKGQLVLGYSEDHIEKTGNAEWEYAYLFDKAAE